MSITENKTRLFRFTSSEIFRLTSMGKIEMTAEELAARPKSGIGSKTTFKEGGFGDTALSYIAEKNLERKLGRSLNVQKHSRDTCWGAFLEQYVHDLLPTSYELKSKETFAHPEHENIWAGSPDNLDFTNKVVADTKCYQPKNFAEYNDVLIRAKETGDLSEWKKDYAKEYWQLISNACIFNFDFIEAITFMPYESELQAIRDIALEYDGADAWKYQFIYTAHKSELAYLPDNCKTYKNLNRYKFEAPKADKDFLTSRVIEAGKQLITI